jgi:hypothetical protein
LLGAEPADGAALAGGFATSGAPAVDVVVTVTGAVGDPPPVWGRVPNVVVPPGDCVVDPPLQVLATQTGAFAFIGALAEVLFDPVEAWFELWPVQVLATQTGAFAFMGALAEVLFDPVEPWFELWPVQVLATQTGAFPFAGALADVPPFVVDPPEP